MTCTVRVGMKSDWMAIVVGEFPKEFVKILALIKVNKLAVPTASDVNSNINLNPFSSDFESSLYVVYNVDNTIGKNATYDAVIYPYAEDEL